VIAGPLRSTIDAAPSAGDRSVRCQQPVNPGVLIYALVALAIRERPRGLGPLFPMAPPMQQHGGYPQPW
jgi:hypothetical protein